MEVALLGGHVVTVEPSLGEHTRAYDSTAYAAWGDDPQAGWARPARGTAGHSPRQEANICTAGQSLPSIQVVTLGEQGCV